MLFLCYYDYYSYHYFTHYKLSQWGNGHISFYCRNVTTSVTQMMLQGKVTGSEPEGNAMMAAEG